jgi:hypothetical protein
LGATKIVAQKKSRATGLEVFWGRAGKADAAIFDVLTKESSQTIKQLLKQISRYKGLEETYYASLTKRLHALQRGGYIREVKPILAEGSKGQTRYELRIKACLAMFLEEHSEQDILDKPSETELAYILLALLNAFCL